MKARKIPLRKCISCQTMTDKKSLLRIVRSPDGLIQIDLKGKLAGRGAYLCSRFECLQLLRKNRALERALQSPIAPDVYEQLQSEWMKVHKHES